MGSLTEEHGARWVRTSLGTVAALTTKLPQANAAAAEFQKARALCSRGEAELSKPVFPLRDNVTHPFI